MDIKNRNLGTKKGMSRLVTYGPELNGKEREDLKIALRGSNARCHREKGWVGD